MSLVAFEKFCETARRVSEDEGQLEDYEAWREASLRRIENGEDPMTILKEELAKITKELNRRAESN